MTEPDYTPLGERLAFRTRFIQPPEVDEQYGYAHGHLAEAMMRPFEQIAELVDPPDPYEPWTPLFYVDITPDWALPWLGQAVGVTIPATATPDQARKMITELNFEEIGKPSYIQSALEFVLISSDPPNPPTVYFREREDGNAYVLEVVTLDGEIPESDKAFTNEAPNPSFEVDLSNWVAAKGGSANATLTTWARQNGWAKPGGWSARYAGSIATAGSIHYINATTPSVALPCVPNEWISAQVAVKVLSNTTRITLSINWLTAANAYISSSNATPIEPGQTGLFDLVASAKAPGTAAKFNVTLQISAVVGSADLYMDEVQISRREKPPAYGDGSFDGWHWVGAAHNSPSIREPTDIVEQVIRASIPAGIKLIYGQVPGWDYEAMTAEGMTYSELMPEFDKYKQQSANER